MAIEAFRLIGRVEVQTGTSGAALRTVETQAERTANALRRLDAAGSRRNSGVANAANAEAGALSSLSGAAASAAGKLSNLGLAAGTALVAGLVAGGAEILRFSAKMEQAKIGFTTLLGSADKAAAHLRELNTFANETPFEVEGLINTSRRFQNDQEPFHTHSHPLRSALYLCKCAPTLRGGKRLLI